MIKIVILMVEGPRSIPASGVQITNYYIEHGATDVQIVSRILFCFDHFARFADDLRLQFEAVSKFTAEEKKVIRSVREGLILEHEAKCCQDVLIRSKHSQFAFAKAPNALLQGPFEHVIVTLSF